MDGRMSGPQAPPRPLRSRLLDIALRALVPFVGIVLLATGLVGIVSFAILPVIESVSSRTWASTQARVEMVDIRKPAITIPLPVDLVELRYHYEFDRRPFVGQQFGPHGLLDNRKSARAFLADVEADPVITIWVDPDNPARAMVHREINWAVVALCLPALLFSAIGGLMVLIGMMIWNDRRSVLRRFRPN